MLCDCLVLVVMLMLVSMLMSVLLLLLLLLLRPFVPWAAEDRGNAHNTHPVQQQ